METIDVTIFNHTITVNPVAFSIGGFDVYWYGLIIASGFLIALVYGLSRARDFKLKTDPMIDCIIVGTIGGIIGARAYYVIFNFVLFKDNLSKVFSIHEGGLAIYGGVIGAFLFGGIACYIRKVKFTALLDVAGIGFLLGQAVGRWGNFVNQEAFGTNTSLPWGMYSSVTEEYLQSNMRALDKLGISVDPSMAVHPTFLYESLWCLLGFVILHFYSKRRKFDGEIILMYAAWYGLGRFFIESLRTDSLYLFNSGIRVSQLVAVVTFVVAVAVIITVRSRKKSAAAELTYSSVFGDSMSENEVMTIVAGDDTYVDYEDNNGDDASGDTDDKTEKNIGEEENDGTDN